VCGVAGWLALRLDSEGVLEALHALFQVLDLALLLGQEQVFDPVQARGVNGGCGLETVLVGTEYGPKTAPVCEPKAHCLRAATRRDTLFQPWSVDPGSGTGPSRGLRTRITAQF
jgi:hypothetical protein